MNISKAISNGSYCWRHFRRLPILLLFCLGLSLSLSSQNVPSELGKEVTISAQNFDEWVKQSDWLIRSNQQTRSQKLLSNLLTFANAHPTPYNLIQAHYVYASYYRYYQELDSASLHSDKMLELVEQEGVSDLLR